MLTDYNITIPNEGWEDCGDGRLLTTLVVNGSKLHLEAFEITNVKGRQVHRGVERKHYQKLCKLLESTCKFYTSTVNGKEYVIFASPFCM